MNVEKLEKLPPPPGILGSLRVGFDIVSSHVWLILPPIVLDSFLWLSMHLSVGKLYSTLVTALLEALKTRPLPADQVKAITDSVETVSRFNWLSWIRTFPVGIPSLEAFSMTEHGSLLTPFGSREILQFDSAWAPLGWFALLTFVGWLGGSVYFRWVSVAALGKEEAGIGFLRAILQTVLISVMWTVCLFVVLMPVMVIVSVAAAFSATLANGLLFVFLFFSYWLVVPFFFMPHGIFARRQNAFYSLYSSLRLTRFTLPTSGLFVFTAFLLNRGLNFLWSVPESDSWMSLVGIAGHAFISTALLAASFVYYRDMHSWLQTVLAQLQQKQGMPAQQA